MKLRITRSLPLLLAITLLLPAAARAQLRLPWEEEEKPAPPPVEQPVPPEEEPMPQPGDAPEPAPEDEPDDAPAAAPTPVEAVYRAWMDRVFARTGGKLKVGSPKITAKKITVTVTLDGDRHSLVFVETANSGRNATIVVGPPNSEGEAHTAAKTPAGWILNGWPEPVEETPEPEPEPEAPPPADGITWQDLSTRRLTAAELAGLTAVELRLLRNEIYARHGHIFQAKDLRDHFSRQPWYRPRVKQVDEDTLPATERYNLNLIMAAEKR